jgi:hypothetical protein
MQPRRGPQLSGHGAGGPQLINTSRTKNQGEERRRIDGGVTREKSAEGGGPQLINTSRTKNRQSRWPRRQPRSRVARLRPGGSLNRAVDGGINAIPSLTSRRTGETKR